MNERQQLIMDHLNEQNYISIQNLMKSLNYSESTIRRDINTLDKLNLLKKVSGGVMKIDADYIEKPTDIKRIMNIKEKRMIADIGIDFIGDYQTIFLDSSSTSFLLSNLLKAKNNLTIFTNNLVTSNYLDQLSNKHDLYFLGGKIQNGITIGPYAFRFMEKIMMDIAFISCRGVDTNFGISEVVESEALLKQALVRHAKKIILLIDHTKFNQSFTFKSLDISKVDYILTNTKPSLEYLEYFRENNIEVIYPNDSI